MLGIRDRTFRDRIAGWRRTRRTTIPTLGRPVHCLANLFQRASDGCNSRNPSRRRRLAPVVAFVPLRRRSCNRPRSWQGRRAVLSTRDTTDIAQWHSARICCGACAGLGSDSSDLYRINDPAYDQCVADRRDGSVQSPFRADGPAAWLLARVGQDHTPPCARRVSLFTQRPHWSRRSDDSLSTRR